MDIYVAPSPLGLQAPYRLLFTKESLGFIAELYVVFLKRIYRLHRNREIKAREVQTGRWKVPDAPVTAPAEDRGNWKVDPVPVALQDRRLDLGDVSPSNLQHFKAALCADVQGIQVDFDDGHCPTWKNEILGHYHVYQAVRNEMEDVPNIREAPVFMFRPRAWNMTEHHMMINGRAIPGPLFDFGLFMYFNGRRLYSIGRGPFFYLSKLESASEAVLWNDIFIWAQKKLKIPIGTIKATVLIEDILATFEMDDILYALRKHSAGLNCGIWDYCASIISKFGERPDFLLPDRNKYVNMDKPFLIKYMSLAVRVCQSRGTFATGGMAALMATSPKGIDKVVSAKRKEIIAGVAGFMVYDINLVPSIKEIWSHFHNKPMVPKYDGPIFSLQLLEMPPGGVTMEGLCHNIRVVLLFITHWLKGEGHFALNGAIEDSATAEISRWQVLQWILHSACTEDTNHPVTLPLVSDLVLKVMKQDNKVEPIAVAIYMRLLSLKDTPKFITTYLCDNILLTNLVDGALISKI